MDITYESLIDARKASKQDSGEFNLIEMANVALKILEKASELKTNGGGNVMHSRQPEQQSGQTQQKPVIDVNQITDALGMVKQLKGDIKISELEKLLKEHKDQVATLLGKLS